MKLLHLPWSLLLFLFPIAGFSQSAAFDINYKAAAAEQDEISASIYEAAYDHFTNGHYQEALKAMQQLKYSCGRKPYMQELRTRCYYQLGAYQQAKDALEVFFLNPNADENTKMNMTMLRIEIDKMLDQQDREKSSGNARPDSTD